MKSYGGIIVKMIVIFGWGSATNIILDPTLPVDDGILRVSVALRLLRSAPVARVRCVAGLVVGGRVFVV